MCHYCETVATGAGNKVSKHHGGKFKSCKLRMRVKFNTLVQTNIFCWFPASPTYSHLGTVYSVTVYIAWVLARHIQVWNQDSLGYGMESGWCRLHCKPFSRAQLLELRF